MAQEIRAKKYWCARCGKAFSSPTRLEHHNAAEHAIRTSRDIQTMSDLRTMSKSSLDTLHPGRAKKRCL
jgi:DNA-directed RNA polymerase subunit RPC12/RpoP